MEVKPMAGGGPIVRKYGFPNFEKIFGAKPIEHGVEEEEKKPEKAEEVRKEEKKKGKD
jgi:hypothetical protein